MQSKIEKQLQTYRKRLRDRDEQIDELSKQLEDAKQTIKDLSSSKDTLAIIDLFNEEIALCRDKQKEYNELIKNVREMQEAMNAIVYKGKWSLVGFLLR